MAVAQGRGRRRVADLRQHLRGAAHGRIRRRLAAGDHVAGDGSALRDGRRRHERPRYWADALLMASTCNRATKDAKTKR